MKLQQLRNRIDGIDGRLLKLLNDRLRCAEAVGRIKKAAGRGVFAPDREEYLLRRLARFNGGPLDEKGLRAIFREILSASRTRQQQLRVAYLGPEGTNCHQAARSRFGTCDEFLSCRTISEVVEIMEAGSAEAGVIPLENTIEGAVGAAYDALSKTNLTVCGEIYLRIRHVLAAHPGSGKLRRIYSHPQALGQCRRWLAKYAAEAELVEVSSTAEGARRASLKSGGGAICGEFAAQQNGLKMLATDLQDMETNLTRFLILCREMPAPTGKDKTSLIFAVPHQVGALQRVLSIFAERKLSLEKIESRPVAGKPWEYLFFIDVRGHCKQVKLQQAIKQVQQRTHWLKLLGSYPQGDSDV